LPSINLAILVVAVKSPVPYLPEPVLAWLESARIWDGAKSELCKLYEQRKRDAPFLNTAGQSAPGSFFARTGCHWNVFGPLADIGEEKQRDK
jgi:hypothetical protein